MPDTSTYQPLAEAQVDSLDELMSRDPIQLRKTSDAEFSKLIEVLITQRRAHEAGEKAPKKPRKPKTPTTKPDQITISDLMDNT
jgi:hypothetical protein